MKKKVYRKRQSWDNRLFDGICNILLALFVIVVFYPIYYIVIASFSDPKYVNTGTPLLYPKGVTFIGYMYVFQDERIWSGYANTILYTAFGTLLGVFVIVLAGYAFSRKDLPGRGLLMKLYVFTMYFSGGLIPTFFVVKRLGMLDTRWVMIILGSVSVYNIIVVRSFMISNIPDELLDASRIDGCGNGRFFVQVVLPLSKAVIAVIVLYVAVSYWNSYMNAVIYITDEGLYPLQLQLKKILYAVQSAVSASEYEVVTDEMMENLHENLKRVQLIKYGTIVVTTLPIICVYPMIQKYFVKGVMVGSIKG